MAQVTAIPTGKVTTPNVSDSWIHKESEFGGSGILICGGTPKASAT